MLSNKFLLSVIIPTKNRQEYCLAAIKQIIGLNSTDIQVVIQDNSETPSLKEEIKLLKCNQIKYNYNGKILSFVDNFSEAVELAEGEYLCIIGDDDGVLPNIIQAAAYAKKNKLDAVIPGLNSFYIWPMDNPIVKRGEHGYLCSAFITSNMYEINPIGGLYSLLYNAGQDYQKYDIPRAYHGLIRKNIVDKIKEKTGKYFGGLTPDIYMATALSILCEKVVRLSFPITIPGICNGSGSADSATGKHTGRLKDAPHFIGHHEAYAWSEEVPAIYTVETIWADTMLHAIEDLAPEYRKLFNVRGIIEICSQKYPQFNKELNDFSKEHSINFMLARMNGYKRHYRFFLERCFNRINRNKADVKKYYNVRNINQAAMLIERELNSKEIKF